MNVIKTRQENRQNIYQFLLNKMIERFINRTYRILMRSKLRKYKCCINIKYSKKKTLKILLQLVYETTKFFLNKKYKMGQA